MYTKRKKRLVTIEQLLTSDPEGHTVSELSQRFGVSERMIFLDISHLRATGSPIIGIPGPGGGIVLDKTNRAPRGPDSESRESVKIFGYSDQRLRLSELLASALGGQPSTAIVLGEMGAGKSFISRDLIVQAEQIGFSILVGNCLERTDSPPYWPWSSILEGIRGVRVPRAATTRFDRSIKILEHAFPIATRSNRVRASLKDALSRNDLLQIQEACRLVIETAAHSSPILIMVEDIQWADEQSLQLMYYLMHSIESVPVLLVLTVRTPIEDSTVASNASLTRILASSRGMSLNLDSLKKSEAAQIMRSVLNSTPPEAAITAAYNLSGGNPFFMREISLLLNHRYDLDSIEPDQQLDIPVSVKLAIQERLKIVEPTLMPGLQLASVLGKDVDQQELETACEILSLPEPRSVIERVMRSGILGTNERTGRLWFAHKLIQQTIYESIEPSRLPEYHSAVARAIEQQGGVRANQQPSDLARHYWAARSIDGLAKYAHYGVLTALEQMAALTPDDVMAQFEAILAIPEDEIYPQDRALALFGMGKCRWLISAGRATTSRAASAENYINAFDIFVELGDTESALMVAADSSFDFLDTRTMGFHNTAEQFVQRDTSVGGRIHLNMALAGYFNRQEFSASDSETLKELSRILYVARRIQDTDLEREVLSHDARIRVDLLDLEAGIDRSLHYLAITEAQGQFADSNDPHFQTSRAYASLGDLALAESHAPRLSRISTSIEHNILTSQLHAMNWSLAICAGDWDAARAVLPGMRQWAEDSQVTEGSVGNSIRILEAYLESMTSITSDLDESWYSLIELSSLPLPSTSDPAQIKAVIAMRTGAPLPMDLARNGLLLPPATNLNTAVRHMGPFHRLARNCALGIHASSVWDVDTATQLYQQLLPHSGIFGGILSAPLSVDRVLGLLAMVFGQTDKASEHFTQATAASENGGFQPEYAQTMFDHARMLMSQRDASGQESAYSLLEKTKEIAKSVQMRGLMAECDELLAIVETPVYQSGLERFELTDRERDVLNLITAGMRNQKIAEELFISINTVQHHVRNILRKTGAPNRTGAAALMAAN